MQAPRLAFLIVSVWALTFNAPCFAFGDKGHKIVALIANHYLEPAVRIKVQTILSADTTRLTPDTEIASEATWSDKFRDSDRTTTKIHYDQTHNWHFVDLELSNPDIDAACFNHPAILHGKVASNAEPEDCVVDKIIQFAAELKNPSTSAIERRLSLQFLLHFIGDVHQPLHASNDNDKGGNDKIVKATGFNANNLHHYWDTYFVDSIGSDPSTIAQLIIASITPGQLAAWKKGDAIAWAKQSYDVSKLWVYGDLGTADATGKFVLTRSYVRHAKNATTKQLARAGVRLAKVLNESLR